MVACFPQEGEGEVHLGPQVVDLPLLLGYRGGVEDDQGSKEGSQGGEFLCQNRLALQQGGRRADASDHGVGDGGRLTGVHEEGEGDWGNIICNE